MKFFAASLAACVLVATAAVAGARPEKANKRFLFDTLNKLVDGAGDTLNHVAHAVIDPLAGGLHVVVDEFNRLVHGRVDIVSVVCKLPQGTTGTRDERINDCVNECLENAVAYLGVDISDSAPSSCPLACQYALDNPNKVTC